MGYHTEPHLERRHHCREHFSLNKWTQLAGYSTLVAVPPQVEEAQQDELPTEYVLPAPAQPMPEATSTIPPVTPPVPPVAPPTLEASITISATEFCAMVHLPRSRLLKRPPQIHHPHMIRPLADHFFLFTYYISSYSVLL
ncbi:hypothetical protein AAG906_010456 [Vitis piasezkii]